MACFLTEDDVQQLLPMSRAIECVEASFADQHTGAATNQSRRRIFLPGFSLHYMAGALANEHWAGMKVYTVAAKQARFLVLLFDAQSGDLLALVEADHLGRIRTGAASGVATRCLARPDASQVGLIGSGRQARTQLEAVAGVRSITAAKVFSRDEKRRRDFAEKMTRRLGFPVSPAESAEQAARFGDIVITATSSAEVVLKGEWLRPGTHVNAIGANSSKRREIDETVLRRAGIITVDSLEQARGEAGDLIHGLAALNQGWDEVAELQELIAGQKPGRTSGDEITVFKSCGLAIWDVAAAGVVYQAALQKKKGSSFRIWEA